MAKRIQFRGGTTAQHSTFTGAIREITVDTDKDTIVVHDGTTVGGFPLARESIVTSGLATKVDKNANIVAGTGTKVTYDSKGLVTSSTTLSASDIPSLDASKITTGTLSLNTTGSASKLNTARSIGISGDMTWSTSFDGSSNVTGVGTLANSGVTAGTYKSVTVDSKGRVTNGTNPTTLSGYGITDAFTKTETNTQISNAISVLIDAAPATLDTLNELAAALGDDPNFATTTSTALGNRVVKNANIVAGTGTKITYDTKGLVTGSTTLSASDIPSLDASKITTGTLSVGTSGNAATATKLATARTINGVTFDGSANITVSDSTAVNLTGNQTVSGVKTFNSSPWVPNLAVTDYSNNAATTAFVSEKISALFAAPNVSLVSNGYQKLPSGLIIQWGISINTSYQTYQTFPLVFPNALYSLVVNPVSSNLAVATNNYIIATGNITKSAFYWNAVDHTGSIQSTAGTLQIIYIAIGC